MTAILKEGRLIKDLWVPIEDEAIVPAEGSIIVTLAQWQRARATLAGHSLGIRLRSDEPPALIAADLDNFSLIALEFPRFGDGRAYSHARILREQLGYRGELRAVGNVLRDQYLFMLRCGFDTVDIGDPRQAPGFLAAAEEFSVFYQPAADGRKPAWALRHQR